MKRYEHQIVTSGRCRAFTLPGIDVLLWPVSNTSFGLPNALLHHFRFKHKRMKPMIFFDSLVRC